jgi:AcrR family transcriptional regulator
VSAAVRTSAPYPEAARVLLRDTVLDAVHRLIRDRGWAQTTMADIAAAAGVSRQTIYNEFGNRADLAQAYVLREAERFIDDVTDAIRAHADTPWAAVSSGLEVFLRGAADDPMFTSITVRDGEASMLTLLITQGGPVVDFATRMLSDLVVELWPQVPRRDAWSLANAMVRLAISHAALPGAPADVTAVEITRMLGPFLDLSFGAGSSAN